MSKTVDPTDVIKAVYVALARGDMPTLLALSDPQIEIYQSEQLPYGGHHHGHEGLKSFLGAVRAALSSDIETGEIYRAGDRVVQVGRTRGATQTTGARFDAAEVHVWQVRNGLVTSLTVYADTDALGAALDTGQAA